MKAVKSFVKTCYSEALISTSSNVADNEREDGSLISEETDGAAREHPYHGGLGLRFKFPGDPKKCVVYLNTRDVSLLTSNQTQRSIKDQAMDGIFEKYGVVYR